MTSFAEARRTEAFAAARTARAKANEAALQAALDAHFAAKAATANKGE